MAKPVQIINDYWLKETILNGNPDLNKFYKEDLIKMVNVLKSENQVLKKQQKEITNYLDDLNVFGTISVREVIDKYNEIIEVLNEKIQDNQK